MIGLARRFLFWAYKHLPRSLRWAISYALSRKFLVGLIFFVEREGGLLLVRHSYQKAWALPGGWLKHRESIEEGARREIREEFGVEITHLRLAHVQASRARPVIDIAVSCDLLGELVADGMEVASFSFFKSSELPVELIESHRAYIAEYFCAQP